MKVATTALCLCFILLFANTVIACDLCAIYRGEEARELQPGFNIGVFEQFTYYGTLQKEGEEVANPTGQYLDSSITQFIVGYQFNDQLGVQVNVPYIYRSFKRPEGFAIDRGVESGIGDMSLIGTYRPWEYMKKDFIFFFTVLGGVKFPTGSSDRIKEEFMEMEVPGAPVSGIHGHDLALGSGSYDGIVGTSLYGAWKRVFATASVQYAIRSEGDFGYRYANDLTWSFKPGYYLLVEHDKTLGVQLSVSGEAKGKDTFQGEKAQDTGVTAMFMGPEVSFTWKEKLSAMVGGELPVFIRNTSLQAVPDYKIRAAIGWRF